VVVEGVSAADRLRPLRLAWSPPDFGGDAVESVWRWFGNDLTGAFGTDLTALKPSRRSPWVSLAAVGDRLLGGG
jgi:hypothetical protein